MNQITNNPWAVGLAAGFLGLSVLKMHFNGGWNQHGPSLAGKIIVITGGNTGLGFEAATKFASLKPKRIILACRDQQRGQSAVDRIKQSTQFNEIEFQPLDLNDLTSVKSFAKDFKYDTIDILMNNAGIMALPERETTVQGYEKQVGVNHLGHFLLTNLLISKVKASKEGRIINVSSLAHKGAGKQKTIDFSDFWAEKNYVPWTSYFYSKLSNVYFTRQLAKNLQDEGITHVKTVSLHPGVVRTELGRYMYGDSLMKKARLMCIYPLFWFFTKTPTQGAQTQIHTALVPFSELENGMYYSDCKVKAETFNSENWEAEAKKLWEISEAACEKYM